jgi:hypothetical protein
MEGIERCLNPLAILARLVALQDFLDRPHAMGERARIVDPRLQRFWVLKQIRAPKRITAQMRRSWWFWLAVITYGLRHGGMMPRAR